MFYVADFETTTSVVNDKESNVWLYAICDNDGNIVNYGYNIESFFKFIKTFKYADIYFHNLAFDGVFILSYLINNNYNRIEKIRKKDNRGYDTLIGDMGQFYQIKVNFARNHQITFLDSLKIINSKVSRIAKDFEIEEQKLKIDYNDNNIDDNKLKYVFNDVIIVAKALNIVKSLGFDKMTVGSSAYNQLLKYNPNIKKLCPELDEEFLLTWRKAYRGGRSQVNQLYQRKVLHNVKRYDINSMYAYIQRDLALPIGYPIPIKKINTFDFELYHIRLTFKLKDKHIPSLLKNGSIYSDSKYYIESDIDEDIYITSIDYKLLVKNYDIYNIEFIEMYGFHTSTFLFKDFIDYYYNLKQNSTGAMKSCAKAMLVNSYGKFGSKLYAPQKVPYMEDGIIKYKTTEPELRKKYYLPIALAICSYAHMLIDNQITMIGYENFVYCDTDSIHSLKELKADYVDNKKLGMFKLEAIEEKAKYIRQKCYITYENKEYHITCSGLTDNTKEGIIKYYGDKIFDVFDYGFKVEPNNKEKIPCKLTHKNVVNGVLLLETTFQIRGDKK